MMHYQGCETISEELDNGLFCGNECVKDTEGKPGITDVKAGVSAQAGKVNHSHVQNVSDINRPKQEKIENVK